MIQFRVDEELCTQCGECAADCPAGIIAMDGYPSMTDEARCYRCQHCLAVCPTGAVSVLGKDPAASTELHGATVVPGQLETLIKGRRAVRRYRNGLNAVSSSLQITAPETTAAAVT